MPLFKFRFMSTSQESLTVYLPPEVKEELANWAKQEKRSMSFLAAQIIAEAVEGRQKKKKSKG